MRIAVVGAGIVGVTCAYELVAAGHDVTVFERNSGVATESSFAPAGLDGPGSALAWLPTAAEGSLFSLARKGLLPPSLAPGSDLKAWAWACRWLRANHRSSVQESHRMKLHRLAAYSHKRKAELTRDLRLDCERSEGVLVVSRRASDSQALLPALASFDERGIRFKRLSAAEACSIEPALNPQATLHDAIHVPDEGAGLARTFAQSMRQHAQTLGARFCFGIRVAAIRPSAHPELELLDSGDAAGEREPLMAREPRPQDPAQSSTSRVERFDAVVVCAAMDSKRLLDPLGVRLPLFPVRGYSLTAPLRADEFGSPAGPRSVLVDPTARVSIARCGSRLRVSGGARLGASTTAGDAAAFEDLYRVLDEWFPGAARVGQVQQWCGVSPTSPTGLPWVGPSRLPGVWLNTGHGGAGWALACGSAKLIASMLGRTAADGDAERLTSPAAHP